MKMKKMKPQKKIMIIILIIFGVYLCISIINLIPYAINFFNNNYIVETSDLPNYSDIFNSIFTVLNIIITSLFSYIIYNIYELQYNTEYNKDVAAPISLLYYVLKINILRSTSLYLNEHLGELNNKMYICKTNNTKNSALEYIKKNTFPPLKRTKEFDDYLKYALGHIEHEKRMKLFALCEDIKISYENHNDIKFNLTYVLSEKLVDNEILMEKDSCKWVYIINSMFNDDWLYLKEDYKLLMENLSNLSKSKKI